VPPIKTRQNHPFYFIRSCSDHVRPSPRHGARFRRKIVFDRLSRLRTTRTRRHQPPGRLSDVGRRTRRGRCGNRMRNGRLVCRQHHRKGLQLGHGWQLSGNIKLDNYSFNCSFIFCLTDSLSFRYLNRFQRAPNFLLNYRFLWYVNHSRIKLSNQKRQVVFVFYNFQLSHETDDDATVPTMMIGRQLEGKKVMAVSSGGQHTILLVMPEAEVDETIENIDWKSLKNFRNI